jgi:hypothetical protein
LFELGNAGLLGALLTVFLEETVKLFEDRGLPAGQQLGTELTLSADLRLIGDAGQKIEHGLCLELRRKRTSGAWHGTVSL